MGGATFNVFEERKGKREAHKDKRVSRRQANRLLRKKSRIGRNSITISGKRGRDRRVGRKAWVALRFGGRGKSGGGWRQEWGSSPGSPSSSQRTYLEAGTKKIEGKRGEEGIGYRAR